jgi:2-oxoglutarate ferredoxin oxidoreductase subunit beta
VAPTDDAARAARRLMTDDGFNCGVLYAGTRLPYRPEPRGAGDPAALEKEFAL